MLRLAFSQGTSGAIVKVFCLHFFKREKNFSSVLPARMEDKDTSMLQPAKYFRISNRISHAIRLMTRYNHGKEATPYYMGGSWDLRGYPRWRIWGTKLFLVSNEFRFPFIDRFAINFPFGGMGFSAIRGATFVDLGNAWDDQLDTVLGSLGFGFRFRLGGVLVLRFDFGRKFTLNDANDPFNSSKFSIDNDLFKQFFFGWDF